MPIYEYVCLSCKKEFEAIRSMSQKDTPIECEKCGSKKVKRKLAMIHAHNGGSASPSTSSGCSSCSSSNCSTCGH